VDPQALELMRGMLKLKLRERLSADECLEHDFLSMSESPEEKEELSPPLTEVAGSLSF
jgi:serine/threonine protein kinase